ncbi:hypothetical protein CHS0354_040025 [Potamilus streckersoni]|uniref:Uncharacterized protein n=1 Tax=Potamilus streckersoni TaxID=2493646 RepID=A0AAE0SSY4_9BIVA|nr:hypothetical protein CHS0354_040025 [Potamilus streckersoni]
MEHETKTRIAGRYQDWIESEAYVSKEEARVYSSKQKRAVFIHYRCVDVQVRFDTFEEATEDDDYKLQCRN